MNSSSVIYALRWLVRDTFRQALASKVFWIMLAFSGLCTVFCLGISIEGEGTSRPENDFLYSQSGQPLTGPNPEAGRLKLLFGAFGFATLHRDAQAEIHLIQVFLGSWVAGTAGLLLTLVWTAGFLPDFLQPSSASVLLAKPVPRWLFVAGKYLGVVLFVFFQAAVFFGATWLALGLKTDVWLTGYLAGCPLLVLHFAVIYSISVLMAVLTRSTVSCILSVITFWAICFGMNYGRHAAVALPDMVPGAKLPAFSSAFIELGYWVIPKPADILMVLEDVMEAGSEKATLSQIPEFHKMRKRGAFDPVASLFSSFLFAAVILAISGMHLAKTDY
jgi:ABC-type transport system involved in multi-copper enzyme maturation permease subunit